MPVELMYSALVTNPGINRGGSQPWLVDVLGRNNQHGAEELVRASHEPQLRFGEVRGLSPSFAGTPVDTAV